METVVSTGGTKTRTPTRITIMRPSIHAEELLINDMRAKTNALKVELFLFLSYEKMFDCYCLYLVPS